VGCLCFSRGSVELSFFRCVIISTMLTSSIRFEPDRVFDD
jgi:hypothetical protein